MVVLAFLSDPPVVKKILTHLELPADLPPVAQARESCEQPDLHLDGENREHLFADSLDSDIARAVHDHGSRSARPARAPP